MKIDDREDLHWPDAVEMERALRRAHQLRSEQLAYFARRGIYATKRFTRELASRLPNLQRRPVRG
ncbi:MAG: hypothetical protein DWQ08_02520 [Proteobacteria bacterium]|nr:MAG: hypothetical protein DWQ08_02520 [Pseudomonadota bacterium]